MSLKSFDRDEKCDSQIRSPIRVKKDLLQSSHKPSCFPLTLAN